MAEIIAIISPIRFKKEMMDVYTQLSLKGFIVLLPVDLSDTYDNKQYKGGTTNSLMELHKLKIDMAHKVYVVNVAGYMGRGTYEEIGYATVKGKPIEYYTPIFKEEE